VVARLVVARLVVARLVGGLVGVDPGWWVEAGVSVGADVDVPAVVVHDPVVVPAEEHQVRQLGGAAVGPEPDVVGVAPAGWAAAAGERAAAVADDEGASGGLGGQRGAVVEGRRRPGRASGARPVGAGDGPLVRVCVGAGGEGGEVVGGAGGGEGDGFAAVVGQVVPAGDEVAEELEEAFSAALGRGAGVGAAVGGVGHGEVLPVGLAGFFAFQGRPAVGVQGHDEVVAEPGQDGRV
jgi:hypothetical protein